MSNPTHKGTREGRLPSVPNPWDLTPTEIYGLRSAILGLTGREAAAKLCISEKTLSTYMTRAKNKLGVATILGAAFRWYEFDTTVQEDLRETVREAARLSLRDWGRSNAR